MSWWQIVRQFIEQYWLGVLALIFSILGFIGREQISKFYREKISPRLHRLYETIKSKIPKRGDEMTKEELKQIASELRGINDKLGDIKKLKKDFEVLKGTVLNETEGVIKDISDKIENVQKEIEKVKFKAEIKRLTAEEKEKLSVSCISSKFKLKEFYPFPPSVKFEFEIDNRFEQSFILDRLLFTASAGETIGIRWYICDDVYLDRDIIKGNDKTTISKESIIGSPSGFEDTNKAIFDGKRDIKWEISIKMFFERGDGLKLLSGTINSEKAKTAYSNWEKWYEKWKEKKR